MSFRCGTALSCQWIILLVLPVQVSRAEVQLCADFPLSRGRFPGGFPSIVLEVSDRLIGLQDISARAMHRDALIVLTNHIIPNT